MSGYRFCRTDDVPLLVDAYNRCYAVHFPEEPRMTVADFRRETREVDLWASSCMVAFSGDEPIGVLLSGKRHSESSIHRIGVRPDQQRRGHGRHLLRSLGRKLRILGPPRLVAEVPANDSDSRRFFEVCGYHCESRYADFVRDPIATSGAAPGDVATADASDELVAPVTLHEILGAGAWDESIPRSWLRSLPALSKRHESIEGLAIGSDLGLEAWCLSYVDAGAGVCTVVAMGCGAGAGESLLGILLRRVGAGGREPVTIPRVSEREVPFRLLASCGFRPVAEYAGYVADAEEPS